MKKGEQHQMAKVDELKGAIKPKVPGEIRSKKRSFFVPTHRLLLGALLAFNP
jgi:hypothetical protein